MTDLSPDDRGFTLGHGLFETLLVRYGEPMFWDQHLDRLAAACSRIGLPPPDRAEVRNGAESAWRPALSQPRAALRITWSAGPGGRGVDMAVDPRPTLTFTLSGAPEPPPAQLVTAGVRRNDGSPASNMKTLSYMDNVLARAEAAAGGGNEALMLNTRGEIACAAVANVFWERRDSLYTPALDCGVLPGVVRAEVFASCARLGIPVVEVRRRPANLAGCALFLTNSLIGLRPVETLDGRACPASALRAPLAADIGF